MKAYFILGEDQRAEEDFIHKHIDLFAGHLVESVHKDFLFFTTYPKYEIETVILLSAWDPFIPFEIVKWPCINETDFLKTNKIPEIAEHVALWLYHHIRTNKRHPKAVAADLSMAYGQNNRDKVEHLIIQYHRTYKDLEGTAQKICQLMNV